jgi:hypothetical protein
MDYSFLIPWRRHRLARRQGTVAATAAAAIALLINQPRRLERFAELCSAAWERIIGDAR